MKLSSKGQALHGKYTELTEEIRTRGGVHVEWDTGGTSLKLVFFIDEALSSVSSIKNTNFNEVPPVSHSTLK